MSAQSILAASSTAERGLVVTVVFAAVVLAVLAIVRGDRRQADGVTVLSRRLELTLLGAIVTAAVFMRTIGYRSALTAPFAFSALTPLEVGKILDEHSLWHRSLELLRQFDSGALQNSAVLLPVAAAFQTALGPSLHLPVLIGAFFGTAAVILAWALGRAAVSRSFGLAFAAFLAVSPLQVVWARLGGVHITAVTHVLLTLWCCYEAGRRKSFALAQLAAVVVWVSFYQYFAARVAIPLGLAMLVAGLRRARAPLGTSVGVLLFALVVLVVAYAGLGRGLGVLWPTYSGYVGNRGETNVTDLIAKNGGPVVRETGAAIRRYFLVERARPAPPVPPYRFGMQFGGLCLVPVALLGVVGLAHALRRPGGSWPWLLLGAAGFAVPVLSLTTARRFLLFDLAWCAFAGFGLLAVARSRLFRGVSARFAFGLATVAVVLVGAWSFTTIVALNRTLPTRHFEPIPFGESGFGDGVTCLRCLYAAYGWRDAIAQGDFVVLFDTDLERENNSFPGGLSLYGRVAALSVGRPSSFLEFYPAMRNLDFEPPSPGPFFDVRTTDFPSYIVARIEAATPRTIVWHFERPTQWERWLASKLVEAGGTATDFQTAVSPTPGLQVRTPWAEREPAFRVLRALVQRDAPGDDDCAVVTRLEETQYPFSVIHIRAPDASSDWLVASPETVAYRGLTFPSEFPAGSGVDPRVGVQPESVHVLTRDGRDLTLHDNGRPRFIATGLRLFERVGLDCAVRVRGHWWAVDPTTGKLTTTDPAGRRVPNEPWIAIGREGTDRLVLGSADQQIVVFDVMKEAEVRRFPAVVSPSRRSVANECSPLLTGNGWYATFNHLTSMLTLYDADGHEMRSRDVAAVTQLGRGNSWITSVAASGDRVAIGHGQTVVTAEVRHRSGCADHASRVGDVPAGLTATSGTP